jgi:hypothetical protein
MTLRPPGVFDRATVGFLLRCGIASLAMIPPVLYLCHSLVTKVAVGVGVFAVSAFALGVLTPRSIWRAIVQVRRSVARTS